MVHLFEHLALEMVDLNLAYSCTAVFQEGFFKRGWTAAIYLQNQTGPSVNEELTALPTDSSSLPLGSLASHEGQGSRVHLNDYTYPRVFSIAPG